MDRKCLHLSLVFLSFLLVHPILGFSFVKLTQDTIKINPGHFRIDHSLRLIIVNQDRTLMHQPDSQRITALQLDSVYYFSTIPDSLVTGIAYQVIRDTLTYSLYFTDLPIVAINARDTIRDEPRVSASFHYATQQNQVISSEIGIEIRGASSQLFPKKSYRIEFLEGESQAPKDVQFPGLRSDDDWNLLAMYNEPYRLGNHYSHALWLKMHKLAYQNQEPEAIGGVRTQYTEVFLNGNYQGIYLITERLDRKQLKLKKFNGQIRGELYKASDWTGPTTFCYPHKFRDSLRIDGGYEYTYPEEEEITRWSNLDTLVRFVSNSDSVTFQQDAGNWFEMDNLVDYFLFITILRAGDNVGKNIYLGRYTAGSRYFLIPWDLDAVLGNNWNGEFDLISDDLFMNNLFRRLLKDARPGGFVERLKARWDLLKTNVLSRDALVGGLNTKHSYLKRQGVYLREAQAWDRFSADSLLFEQSKIWFAMRHQFIDTLIRKSEVASHPKQFLFCGASIYSGANPVVVIPVDLPPDTLVSTDPINMDTLVSPDPLNPDTLRNIPVITIYPNPTNESIEVGIKETLLWMPFAIKDVLGRTVKEGILESRRTVMGVPGLRTGFYFFQSNDRVVRFYFYRE